MLKVLGFFTFILFSQVTLANDFLRSGKQLLVCEKEEILFRINWEDWDIENKSFGIRSRDKYIKFILSINRDEADQTYKIDSEYITYKDGEVINESSSNMSIGPFLGDGHMPNQQFQLHYVDKEKVDDDLKKICKN